MSRLYSIAKQTSRQATTSNYRPSTRVSKATRKLPLLKTCMMNFCTKR